MKKNGFTLIELLGVIIILSLLMIFALPKIINSVKSSNDKIDALTMRLISNAADLYMEDNQKYYPKSNGNNYCITLQELVEGGYLKTPITLSDSDIDVTNLKSVKATYNNKYQYELLDSNKCVRGNDFIPDASGRVYLSNVTSDSILDYRIYGNSIQNGTPTPDSPIDIVSLGENKNLFNISKSISNLIGLTVSQNVDGTYNLRGTPTTTDCYFTSYDLNSSLAPGDYIVSSSFNSISSSTIYTGIQMSGENDYTIQTNSILNNSSQLVTPTSKISKLSFIVRGLTVGEYTEINNIKVQLEQGTVATQYVNNSYIGINVSGKNLVQLINGFYVFSNGIFISNVPTQSSYISTSKVKINYSNKYIVTTSDIEVGWVQGALFWGKDNNYLGDTTNGIGTYTDNVIIPPANAYYMAVDIAGITSENIEQALSQNFMIEEGNIATSYESYQLNTTLIDLTGYEPLRCVEKICDYLDYRNQRIVRNIGKVILDGDEIMGIYNFEGKYGINIAYMLDQNYTRAIGAFTHDVMSNMWIGVHNGYIYWLGILDKLSLSTVEQFKSWLIQEHSRGTPVTIYYQLATPVYESITLPEIKLVSGTSIISFGNNIIPSKLSFNY